MSRTQGTIALVAPLSGVMVRLDQVPDPVFARRMVGDGFSVDPVSDLLVAPVAGEIVDVQPSRHAVTLRTAEGLDVLMHIGLDTVRLDGEGFDARVTAGDHVTAGQPLIAFDLDQVARNAKSLLTQVVITNGELVESMTPAEGFVTAGEDVALEVTLGTPEAADVPASGASATSDPVVVPNPTGLHARPVATMVGLAKGFGSEVRLRRGDDEANAKSIVSVMGLAIGCGDTVVVTARGADAPEAVEKISQAIRHGLGEDVPPLASPPTGSGDTSKVAPVGATRAADAQGDAAPVDPDLLRGVSASPGLGVGTVVQLRRNEIEVEEDAADRHEERRRLDAAIDRALVDLSALEHRLEKESSRDKAAIFAAHQEILQDPELLDMAVRAIDDGRSAAYAWQVAYTQVAGQLAGLSNEVLAGRANDVRDVGQRVLERLTGQRTQGREIPAGTILVAEDLTPSDTAQLDRSKVVGFATTRGGASSHVAIIARSLDIPAIAGIESRALDIADGTRVVLDGTAGQLRLNLDDTELDAIAGRQRRQAARRAAEEAARDEPAVTTDGHRVQVVANIGSAADARQSQSKGAEGVGLLRSEFAFLDRPSAPTEQEQAAEYVACAQALAPGQPLVIRTLDVGGDKPLDYLPIPAEENPFLGLRGVRIGLEKPDILRTQVRAILAAADAGARLQVMFPMIATMEDWRRAKAIFDHERELVAPGADVSVGIMMEVPSVAVMARQFAAEEGCDFFSVGTNDLTSYVLAMDRGHPKLAAQVDPCNPAVLMLIKNAADALHERGKWLGVCGGVASDPQAVPILVGLGVDELSCSIPAIPSVKAMVRNHSLESCRELGASAIACATAAEVRSLVPMDED